MTSISQLITTIFIEIFFIKDVFSLWMFTDSADLTAGTNMKSIILISEKNRLLLFFVNLLF